MAVLALHGDARKASGRVDIKICWDDVGFDIIKAGSPFGSDGRIHNDSKACGIVQGDCERRYCGIANVIIAGHVSKLEAENLSGIKLTKEAISAMNGIRFTDDGGLLNAVDRE